MRKIFGAYRFNFLYDRLTGRFRNPNLSASLDDKIPCRIAVVEQRGGMLTVRSFRRIGYVVSRCKAPYAIPADETEVLGVVVLVVAYKIEHHPSIHLLDLKRILSQISCQGKKICVVNVLIPEI